jgi:hypothetical protein
MSSAESPHDTATMPHQVVIYLKACLRNERLAFTRTLIRPSRNCQHHVVRIGTINRHVDPTYIRCKMPLGTAEVLHNTFTCEVGSHMPGRMRSVHLNITILYLSASITHAAREKKRSAV